MDLLGLVFDIQRFSLHDGPGIRTTVFLKGCPLNCLWCHNPESKSFKPQVSYDQSKCVNCMECVKSCSSGAHKNVDGKHQFDFSKSSQCTGSCVKACAYGALKLIGRQMSVDEVLQEVLKDALYYKNSGGGVTISGGEPLLQFDFTLQLLKKLKEHDISTCVETCGQTSKGRLHEIMPYTDLFLYDYKATGNNSHQRFTGVNNTNIISNFNYLYSSGADMILRCPLVPGVNDQPEHLKQIAQLSNDYPRLKAVEIMPYHDLGNDKSRKIGEFPALNNIPAADENKKNQWIELLKQFNCSSLLQNP